MSRKDFGMELQLNLDLSNKMEDVFETERQEHPSRKGQSLSGVDKAGLY